MAPPAVHAGIVLASGIGVATALVSLWGVLFWLPLLVGFEYGLTVSNESIASYASIRKALLAVVNLGSILLAVGYVVMAFESSSRLGNGIVSGTLLVSSIALVLLIPVFEKLGVSVRIPGYRVLKRGRSRSYW